MERFDGRTAVVTGGARGLGKAIVRLLAGRGATVHALDYDAEGVAATAAELGAAVTAHACDVTDEDSILAARDAVLAAAGGRIDVLVNNAGVYFFEDAAAITVESWDRTFDTNTRGMFLVTRSFADALRAGGDGRVVFIVSSDAYIAKPLYPHYAASKAAVRSLVKTFALDMAADGVLVNGVSPGGIATERAHDEGWLPQVAARVPLGRAAEPEEIAEVVLFLASTRNSFVTGETVIAAGGEIMD